MDAFPFIKQINSRLVQHTTTQKRVRSLARQGKLLFSTCVGASIEARCPSREALQARAVISAKVNGQTVLFQGSCPFQNRRLGKSSVSGRCCPKSKRFQNCMSYRLKRGGSCTLPLSYESPLSPDSRHAKDARINHVSPVCSPSARAIVKWAASQRSSDPSMPATRPEEISRVMAVSSHCSLLSHEQSVKGTQGELRSERSIIWL